ncbi:amidase family protein [Bradyrhizobium sp. U87765 SZCCT0131]|uniref:amidase family protein n=1 Tax=unclassified Bradyrhizobium TaxID=2631580 RepID=UPI001BAD1741|nr:MULTISPECIES: amidase family protein [unclassified Bradyrhizobium]MBR1218840.1 amidase family protein [Bradyrhizobium sp. U87765 SZCCT0131]MBR1261491.1 amidase family protein [Bradyrhizobium sp. U87765 SZCCT0134]MBR1306656.1 amidase family protein [Bradyrhizobium sp. U87765 SZCCT0110]MBR1317273.1 amidase family protein [Bradyrhizobium sp. U87765 SZCCT0109]MBR1350975.1 amidase family protein [Bradyrhizobium sp. U87765 SZCCT0048]
MHRDLWRWSATELGQAIGDRSISSREAVQASLDRIAAVNPTVNAVVQVLADEALAAADQADAAVKAGLALGPLHGVPVTVKVNIDQRGCATTDGVVAFRDGIATEDHPVVANLRKAGAVIVGRTNTPAFSHRWFTDNDLHGATRNPWSRRLTPGGSSGGAAAAVAAGMGAIAHGNDFGGSIRYPAYACGVAGLRPTPGRIPQFNPSWKKDAPLTAQLMAVQGPLARSIADLRAGLAVMAAGDPRDGNWMPVPLEGARLHHPIRAAIAPDPDGSTAPEVRDAVRAAGRALADAGYLVEEVTPPRFSEAAQLWHELVINEEQRFLAPAMRQFGDEKSRRNMDSHIAYAPKLDGDQILAGFARRLGIMRAWQLFMERYPVVVLPVSHQLPFRNGLDQESEPEVRAMIDAQQPLLAVAVVGCPSVVVPTGVVGDSPVGVQVVAGRFREDVCFDAAQAIEARASIRTPIDPRE